MEERLTMTTRELDRLKVIHQVLQHKLTWPQAGAQLARSVRQIGRLCARVRTEGHKGIVHRLRSRPSNHHLRRGVLARALELVKTRDPDFGPTFANEKLRSRQALVRSIETLRQGMRQAGLWTSRRRRAPHRAWRPRRSCVGELVQLDGSDHAWFEPRGPRGVRLSDVDDATSRVLAGEFVAVEDTVTLLRTTQTDLQRYGRPVAFSVDKDSIYRVNRQATIEEPLQDSAPLTQFTRAMRELGVEVICAPSPQAKGRVERGFQTHQDRLVKARRLTGISTVPEANHFLHGQSLPRHNARVAVEPAHPLDAHRPLLPTHDLEAICSIQTTRTVERDVTLRLQNRFFQLGPEQPVRGRPRDTVLIEQRLDGTVPVRAKGRDLAFTPIAKRPPRRPWLAVTTAPVVLPPRPPYHPPRTHPWKAPSYAAMRRRQAAVHARHRDTPMPPPVTIVDPAASQRPTHRDPSASDGRSAHGLSFPPFPPRPPSMTTTTTPP